MKQIYIISYDNSQYCGGELHCLVWATSESDAEYLASDWMEETQIELFSDEYEDDPLEEGDMAASFQSAELVEGSKFETYVNDPSQASFYPHVN